MGWVGWGKASLLRLLALAAGLFFVWCEAEGTYEFLLSQQPQHVVDFAVRAGTGFAAALGLLPLCAGHAVKNRQWSIAIACWLAVPIAMAVVYYAAIQRSGGAADQIEAERLRQSRAGTLAARTERDATENWETAREAATGECASGRGSKCIEAETKRDAAWGAVLKARGNLRDTPATQPASGERRVVAALAPFLVVTEDQVRLYQPMLIPVGISVLATVFLTAAILLHTPPMPWSLRCTAPAKRMGRRSDVIDGEVISETTTAPLTPVANSPLTLLTRVMVQLTEMLELGAPNDEVEIEDLYDAHAARHPGLSPNQFIECAHQFCCAANLTTRTQGDKFFIQGVRLTERGNGPLKVMTGQDKGAPWRPRR
jgi:hypothetical protein